MNFPLFLKSFIEKISKVGVITKRDTLTHPSRDWWIALISFVLVIVFLLLWSVYLFWRLDSGQLSSDTENTSSFKQTFNRADLQKTLLEYQKRDLFYKNILDVPPRLESPR